MIAGCGSSVDDAAEDSGTDVEINSTADGGLNAKQDSAPAKDAQRDTQQDTRQHVSQDVQPDTTPDVQNDTQPDTLPDVQPDTPSDVHPDVEPDTQQGQMRLSHSLGRRSGARLCYGPVCH